MDTKVKTNHLKGGVEESLILDGQLYGKKWGIIGFYFVDPSTIDHDLLVNYDPDKHRKINDAATGNTDLWSANKIDSELADKLDSNTPITGDTKTKITYDANGLVTGGADATTADINDSLNRRYVSDVDLTTLSNTSGINSGDEVQATQTVAGIAEIATVAEINTGTDDTRIITPLGLAWSQIQTDVTANNAKVTNATHTGEVTGSGALTLDPTAISNKPAAVVNTGMEIVVNDGGVLRKIPASDVMFLPEYQYAADAAVSTTTSTTFQNKLTLNTSNLPLGNYRIAVYYGWNHDGTTNDFEARVQLNAVNLGDIHKQEPKDSAGTDPTGTTQRYLWARIYEPQNLSGVQTITLDYRTDTAGVESSVRDTYIEIFRVS